MRELSRMYEGYRLSRIDDHRYRLRREDRNRSIDMCLRYLLYENNGVSLFRERNRHQVASSEGTCEEDPVGRYSTTYNSPQFQRYLEHLRQRSRRDGCRRHRLNFGEGR